MDETDSPLSIGAEDRISELSDELIHSILSFIDMKYAVQASVLSKRWRYIWRSLPVLNFDASETFTALKHFVHMVLKFRDNCCIQRFHLNYYRDNSIGASDIYTWIDKAVSHNVEELCIKSNSWGRENFILSDRLCTCRTLTKLELELRGHFRFLVPDSLIVLPKSVSLPRLKSMSLRFNYLWFEDDNLADNLFTNCPALESLVLEVTGCRPMSLTITLPKLKNCSLQSITHASKVTLCAPNITSFICSATLLEDYCLEGLSSLVTADIRINIYERDKVNDIELRAGKKVSYAQSMVKLMRGLHNAKALELTSDFRVLSGAPGNLDCELPEFPNLQRLVLTTWLSRGCVDAIIHLLKKSHNIEFLALKIEPRPSSSAKDFWSLGLSLPFSLYHLKHIVIGGLRGYANELKFIKIMLNNAMALEKVVLFSDSSRQDSQGNERMEKFKETLLAYPGASTSIIWFEF